MNIMELVEGKKYKDDHGRTWYKDKRGYIGQNDENNTDITHFYDSVILLSVVFTEVKEPITITLEAEELDLLKKAWVSCELMVCDVNVSTSVTKKLNGIKCARVKVD